MIIELKNAIRNLVTKSNQVSDPNDAMKYAQAALNLAHALDVLIDSLKNVKNEEPEMVPAEPEDMNAALVQISQELGCQCNLDDILHAIDRLKE